MPTPMERLTTRKALQQCRVCAWLTTLDERQRREWQAAITSTRFGSEMVASEIALDVAALGYDGPVIGESSVASHRQRGHK